MDLSSNNLNRSKGLRKHFESGWTEIFQLDEDLELDSTSNVQSNSSPDENDSDDEFIAPSSGRKTRKLKSCGSKQAPNFMISLQRICNLYHEMHSTELVGSPQPFYLDHYLRWSSTPKEEDHVES